MVGFGPLELIVLGAGGLVCLGITVGVIIFAVTASGGKREDVDRE
jgi:hypothetical protein